MKKTAKGFLLYLPLIMGILLIVCSCQENAADRSAPYPPENNLFEIQKDGKYSVLNANGEFVLRDMEIDGEVFFLRDKFTGEPKYLQTKKDITISDTSYDEDGNEIAFTYEQTVYALYDTKGNLLKDYNENHADAAFGDYLDIYENGQHQIKNMKTGEIVLKNCQAKDFIDNMVMIEGAVEGQSQVWIYSKDMKLLQTAPSGYYYGGTIKDRDKHYYGLRKRESNNGRELYYIFDEDFHLCYHHPHHNMFVINNGYLIAQSDLFDFTVINLATGETVLTRDKDRGVYYYDGNLMITGENIDGTLAYPWNQEDSHWEVAYLQQPERNETFSYLAIVYPYDNTYHLENEQFYIYCKRENGDQVILDEKGNIISECNVTEDGYRLLDGAGNIILTIPKDCAPPAYTEDMAFFTVIHKGEHDYQDRAGLFTADGTQIPLDEKYQHAKIVTCYADGTGKKSRACIQAGYSTPEGEYCYSFLDMTGNPLLEDVTMAPFCAYCSEPYFDGYRLVAEKDGYQGLMDMSGNWLYQEPISK